IGELLGIVREMNPEGTKPGVGPQPPPKVGLVLARTRRRVPVPVVADARREVRLDPDQRNRERRTESHGALRGAGLGQGLRSGRDLRMVHPTPWQIYGTRDQEAANQSICL